MLLSKAVAFVYSEDLVEHDNILAFSKECRSLLSPPLGKDNKVVLETGQVLLHQCVIILLIVSTTLSKPGKVNEMTLSFMEEELMIICGHLRESLELYNDKAEIPLREVGQARSHLIIAEVQIANWIRAENYSGDQQFDVKNRIEMQNVAFYKMLDELKSALKQIKKHEKLK